MQSLICAINPVTYKTTSNNYIQGYLYSFYKVFEFFDDAFPKNVFIFRYFR